MKRVGVLLLVGVLIAPSSLSGQPQPTLEKSWIGPENQCLRIRKEAVDWILVGLFSRGKEERLFYSVTSDTLSIVRQYPDSSDDSGFRRTVDNYRILKLSRDSLVISRILKRRGSIVEVPDEPPVIAFVDSAAINDTKLTFNHLTFSTTSCFGACPVYKIFIDSRGNVRFRGERDTDPFIGSYMGNLPRAWMEKFVALLRRSRVEEISQNSLLTLDAPVLTLTITLNGRTTGIEGTDFSPFNSPLFDMLYVAYHQANLVKVDSVAFEK